MNQPSTTALVHELAESTDKTTPIGRAIRDDIVAMCNAEPFDLDKLGNIRRVAQHGRGLLACRNPVAAFDARQNAGTGAPGGTPYAGPVVALEDDYDHDYADMEGMPMARELRDRQQEMIREEMAKSALAKAVKAEILEITQKDPFAATELLEIDQLAAHSIKILRARLGLKPPAHGDPCRPQRIGMNGANFYYGANPIGGYGQGGSLASSPETFGATVARELLGAVRKLAEGFHSDPSKMVLAAATAREKGLDDVADRLEAKLKGDTQETPTQKEQQPCCGTSPVGTATSGSE